MTKSEKEKNRKWKMLLKNLCREKEKMIPLWEKKTNLPNPTDPNPLSQEEIKKVVNKKSKTEKSVFLFHHFLLLSDQCSNCSKSLNKISKSNIDGRKCEKVAKNVQKGAKNAD